MKDIIKGINDTHAIGVDIEYINNERINTIKRLLNNEETVSQEQVK